MKRKIEKKREKVLYCDSILTKNPFVQAVPSSINKKSKKKLEEGSKAKETSEDGAKVGMFDMWSDKGAYFLPLITLVICISLLFSTTILMGKN